MSKKTKGTLATFTVEWEEGVVGADISMNFSDTYMNADVFTQVAYLDAIADTINSFMQENAELFQSIKHFVDSGGYDDATADANSLLERCMREQRGRLQ